MSYDERLLREYVRELFLTREAQGGLHAIASGVESGTRAVRSTGLPRVRGR